MFKKSPSPTHVQVTVAKQGYSLVTSKLRGFGKVQHCLEMTRACLFHCRMKHDPEQCSLTSSPEEWALCRDTQVGGEFNSTKPHISSAAEFPGVLLFKNKLG